MTKEELIKGLKEIKNKQAYESCDWETHHILADELLLKFINNDEVSEAFNSIDKWYS